MKAGIYTSTEVILRESIYRVNLEKMVSMLYDRFYGEPETFTVKELEDLEYAATICGSKFLTSISLELEKRQ